MNSFHREIVEKLRETDAKLSFNLFKDSLIPGIIKEAILVSRFFGEKKSENFHDETLKII